MRQVSIHTMSHKPSAPTTDTLENTMKVLDYLGTQEVQYYHGMGRWIMQIIGQNITQNHIIRTYEKEFLTSHIVIEMLQIDQQQKKYASNAAWVPTKSYSDWR